MLADAVAGQVTARAREREREPDGDAEQPDAMGHDVMANRWRATVHA